MATLVHEVRPRFIRVLLSMPQRIDFFHMNHFAVERHVRKVKGMLSSSR